MGLGREYTEQQEYEKIVTALRERFGEDEFEKVMASGQLWSEDHVLPDTYADS